MRNLSRIRVVGSAFVLVAILTAGMAQTAQAHEWSIEGKAFQGLGIEEESATSTGGPFELAVPGKLTLECENEASTGKLVRGGTGEATVTLSGSCHVIGAPACIVAEPITAHTATQLITGTDGELYDKVVPRSGTALTALTISGCALAGTFPVTGSMAGKTAPAGTELVEQPVTFSAASEAAAGAVLKFGGTAAHLAGSAKIELSGKDAGEKWSADTPEPLPNETTIAGFGGTEEEGKEVPVIDWEVESPITTKGCEGGEVTVSVRAENVATHEFETREASLSEKEPGKFFGKIPVMKPLHGKATVQIKVSGCKKSEASLEVKVDFECWIDPSGIVVDGNHEDVPLWGATVTLLSSESETGTYTLVEEGSAVMSPANRVNPDRSRADGAFGWDVEEGWYKVEAAKPGCGTATTEALFVPPPRESLELVLHCEGEQWRLGEAAGEIAQLAVTAPAEECDGDIRVENVSFGTANIRVLKETGIGCTVTKPGCEGETIESGEKCEAELEEPGAKPEYELEVEWDGEIFIERFPA